MPRSKTKPRPSTPKPRLQRIEIDDATMETIPILLAQNERGLLMVRDEITALNLGANQYKGGKGNDRQFLLKVWSGDAITKDRVAHEDHLPIRSPHPSLSIVGGIPPDMLGSILDDKGRSDGFIDRWLLTYPDSLTVPDWSERGMSDETSKALYDLMAQLWARPMNVKEGRSVPHVAYFTPEGKRVWEDRYNAHAAEINAPDFPATLRGPWVKLKEYAGRFALILACLRHASDPTADPAEVPTVGPRVVDDAWRLVTYFKSHARRIQVAMSSNSGIGGDYLVKSVVAWLREGNRLSFTERDFKQVRRTNEGDDLKSALAYLVKRHAIRPQPADEPKGRRGRPASPTYDVNPALLGSQNSQNTQNVP